MEYIITGNWGGEPIWRRKTAADDLEKVVDEVNTKPKPEKREKLNFKLLLGLKEPI